MESKTNNNNVFVQVTPAILHDIQQAASWPPVSDPRAPQDADIATLAGRYNDLIQLATRLRDTPSIENIPKSRCQCKSLTSQIRQLEEEISALRKKHWNIRSTWIPFEMPSKPKRIVLTIKKS